MKAPAKTEALGFCFYCDARGDLWESRVMPMEQEFEGRILRFSAEVMVCKNCGAQLFEGTQFDDFMKAAKLALREEPVPVA